MLLETIEMLRPLDLKKNCRGGGIPDLELSNRRVLSRVKKGSDQES